MLNNGGVFMDFTSAVKKSLSAKGLRAIDISRLTGYSPQYINDLLLRRRRWNETTIKKVSKALGIKIFFKITVGGHTDEIPEQ
jgi:cyanate lyase